MQFTFNSRLIGLAAKNIKHIEALKILNLINKIQESSEMLADELCIIKMVKARKHSTAFNTIALLIHRCVRELESNPAAAQRVPWVRALLNIREIIFIAKGLQLNEHIEPAGLEKTAIQYSDLLADAIAKTYQIFVGRRPESKEIEIWRDNFKHGLEFHEFFLSMNSSQEGQQHKNRRTVLPDCGDGLCIQLAYELTLGRGASAFDINFWQEKLDDETYSREGMVISLLETSRNFYLSQADSIPHDGQSCLVMGTATFLTAGEWKRQASVIETSPSTIVPKIIFNNRFHIKRHPELLVSVLTSLYCGGDFIEKFMDNITTQDGFDEYCEIIIIDADSPEREYQTIKRFEGRHKNIKYIRCNYRIGIYDAWNMAAKCAQGDYLTNANLDDMRRCDSLMLQAGVLENLPFVDVVYQDLYYTFDPNLLFESIAAFEHKTRLPVITPHNMINFNSPHNAPMWRKRLHNELGYFNTTYKSAGDYEFWMRCLAANKVFYKINDPHVVYYQNPRGLSTRSDTKGVIEAMAIQKQYCRKIMPSEVVVSAQEFIRLLNEVWKMPPQDTRKDRYALTQDALRNLARSVKYSGLRGVGE